MITIRVVPYEQGGLTTDLKDRPSVRYDVEVKADASQPQPEPAKASPEAGE